MKRYSASKEINTLVHQLVRDGWQFQRGGQHGKLYAPKYNLFKRTLDPERSAGLPQLSAGRTPGPAPGLTIATGTTAESGRRAGRFPVHSGVAGARLVPAMPAGSLGAGDESLAAQGLMGDAKGFLLLYRRVKLPL